MLNGEGLRVVLWLSGCNHHCYNCQNPQTHDCNSGIPFDISAKEEIFEELSKDYVKGITFSGGDPLHENNLIEVFDLCKEIKEKFTQKDIWIYSGYTFEEIFNINNISDETSSDILLLRKAVVSMCDVLVDGRYIEELKDNKYHWAGSTNQRIIDMKTSLKSNNIILKT